MIVKFVGTKNKTIKQKKIKSKKLKNDYKKEYCKGTALEGKNYKTRKIHWYLIPKFSRIANHSAVYNPNKFRDTCTDINVWKYQVYRDGKLIESDKPITTTKRYSKNKELPQIISLSLFGSKPKYIEGVKKYIESLKRSGLLKKWDVRIYIASRKDNKNVLLSTNKNIQKILLNNGLELAHVDNGNPNGYSLEGTFWRFLPVNERCRVLIRDVDDIVSAHELISISEWINSGLTWTRIMFFCCISPFIASGIGVIGKPGLINDYINKLKNYPYKKKYGDDELFTKDYMFLEAIKTDSLCTHYYNHNQLIKEHYKNSVYFPTNEFIKKILSKPINKQNSKDILLPKEYKVEGKILNLTLKEMYSDKYINYFSLKSFGKRGKKAIKTLGLEDVELHK